MTGNDSNDQTYVTHNGTLDEITGNEADIRTGLTCHPLYIASG